MQMMKDLITAVINGISRENFWFGKFEAMYGLYRLSKGFSTYSDCWESVSSEKLSKKKEDVYQAFLDMGLVVSSPGISTTDDPVGFSMNSENAGEVDCAVLAEIRSKSLEFAVCGDEVISKKLMEKIKLRFPSTGKLCKSISRISRDGAVSLTTLIIDDKELKSLNPLFYPYIDDLNTIGEDFNNSSSNLLFLIGPAGTGKTSFTRSLMGSIDRALYTATSSSVVCHEDLPAALSDEVQSNSITLIEDADHILGKRKDGNEKLSGILNILSGLSDQNKKMIITTNLETIKDVDEALLRPGRTFRTIMFRPLTTIEANAARASIGLPELVESDFKHISQSKGITLAEALNFEEYMKTHKSQKVGF